MSIQFSDVSGENVQILEEKSLARWNMSFSGGYVFPEKQLPVDDVLSVQLDGSGHVSLGMMKRDPKTIKNFRELEDKKMVKSITDLRVHRRTCDVIVKQRIEDGSRKITFEYSGQRIVVKCSKSETVWLVFCLKFGNVTAKMESPFIKFHSSCGENIEFTNKNRTLAKLRVENPASLCCVCRHIYINESVQFNIRSIKDGDRPPSKYYFSLGVSKMDAKQLSANDPESFIVGVRALSPYRWDLVKKFEKDECEGDLRVGLNSQGHLTYSHSSGISGEAEMEIENNRAVIVFELFRVEVKIQDLITGQNYDYAESYDDVLPVGPQESAIPIYVNLIPEPETAPPVAPIKASPIAIRRQLSNPSEVTSNQNDDPNYEAVQTSTSAPLENINTKPDVKPKPINYRSMLATTLVSVPAAETDKKELYWEVKEMPKNAEVSNSEPVNVFNSGPVKVSNSEPIKVPKLEPVKVFHSEPIKLCRSEPVKVSHSEPVKVPKSEPVKVSLSEPLKVSGQEENNNKVNTVKELVERFARMGSDEESKKTADVATVETKPEEIVETKSHAPVSNLDYTKETSQAEGATSNSPADQGEILGETFRSINVLLNLGKKGNKENKKKKKK